MLFIEKLPKNATILFSYLEYGDPMPSFQDEDLVAINLPNKIWIDLGIYYENMLTLIITSTAYEMVSYRENFTSVDAALDRVVEKCHEFCSESA